MTPLLDISERGRQRAIERGRQRDNTPGIGPCAPSVGSERLGSTDILRAMKFVKKLKYFLEIIREAICRMIFFGIYKNIYCDSFKTFKTNSFE